ncbi:MAG: hypothetical protein [Microviridae sp.]|nr:MAG: hypothetical protein [Microviridae sp.]
MDWFQQVASGAIKNLKDFTALIGLARREKDATSTSYERFVGNFEDGTEWNIPVRLAFPSHFNTQTNLEQNDRADWQQTDPFIQMFAARLIEALRRRQIPFYVHEAFRTKEKQQAAFKRGNSKAQYPRAAHCQGKAVDIVHGLYHWALTPDEWRLIGILGKEVLRSLNAALPPDQRRQLVWGGDFKSIYDPAHWEMSNWREKIVLTQTQRKITKTPRYILANGLLGATS